MCNIKEKTDLKTVTVYKAVEEINGDYYSYFAGTKIEIGEVKKQTLETMHPEFRGSTFFTKDSCHYREEMVGKSSGFKYPGDAKSLTGDGTVLKMALGGEIWIGDAANIDFDIPEENIIYAGTEILSFKEI